MSNENTGYEAVIDNDPFKIDFSKVEAFSGGGAFLPAGVYKTHIFNLELLKEDGEQGRPYVLVTFKVSEGDFNGQTHLERVYMPKAAGKLKEILEKAGLDMSGPLDLHKMVAEGSALGRPIEVTLTPNGNKSEKGRLFMNASFNPIEGAERAAVGAPAGGGNLPGQAPVGGTTLPGTGAPGGALPGMPS